MNKQTEALKMAIEAMERYGDTYGGTDGDFEALKACEEALEQPAQEPVAWMPSKTNGLAPVKNDGTPAISLVRTKTFCVPLYTHPHQWQGLTDDEIGNAFHLSISKEKYETGLSVGLFARAIEAKLKEKNT